MSISSSHLEIVANKNVACNLFRFILSATDEQHKPMTDIILHPSNEEILVRPDSIELETNRNERPIGMYLSAPFYQHLSIFHQSRSLSNIMLFRYSLAKVSTLCMATYSTRLSNVK